MYRVGSKETSPLGVPFRFFSLLQDVTFPHGCKRFGCSCHDGELTSVPQRDVGARIDTGVHRAFTSKHMWARL